METKAACHSNAAGHGTSGLVTGGGPDSALAGQLVAEAARKACTEYCSWCQRTGGYNGRLCAADGIHYCRILAAHIAGKISNAHLEAVQAALGSPAPVPEKLLNLEPWQALQAARRSHTTTG